MAMSNFTVKFNAFKSALTTNLNAIVDLITALKNRLNSHTTARGNVHGLEPVDIGLGNVPDWLLATTEQAEKAVSNSTFTTPRRVRDYADANIYDPVSAVLDQATDEL